LRDPIIDEEWRASPGRRSSSLERA
jgi:hypothetical protein